MTSCFPLSGRNLGLLFFVLIMKLVHGKPSAQGRAAEPRPGDGPEFVQSEAGGQDLVGKQAQS